MKDKHVPPHSIEAEMAVLGAMILDQGAIKTASSMLSVEDFYRPTHRQIYKTLVEMQTRGREVDLVTLPDVLQGKGILDNVGGLEYLIQLAESLPSIRNAEYYAEIVLDMSALRRMAEAGKAAFELAYDQELEPSERVSRAQELFGGIRTGKRLWKDAFEIASSMSSTIPKTMPTCWPSFNDLTSFGGLTKGEPHLICAQTGFGKSLIGSQLARDWALKKGLSVVVVSLELSAEIFIRRLLLQETGFWSWEQAKKAGRESEYEAKIKEIDLIDLFIFDYGSTPRKSDRTTEAVLSGLRAFMASKRVDAVIIDYVQLLAPGSKRGDYRDHADTAHELKWFAKQTGVCLVELSQEKMVDGRLVTRGSLEYEDAAASVTRLNRSDGENQLIIAKSRHGKPATVDLRFIESRLEFVEDPAPNLVYRGGE